MPKYTKLVSNAIAKSLKDKYFEGIRLCPEFYLEKGWEALQAFAALPLDAALSIEFLEAYAGHKGSYKDFIFNFPDNSPQRQMGLLLGKLMAYLDKNATNKTEWNEYADKRVASFSKIKQEIWVRHLLQYIQNEKDIHKVSNHNIKYCLEYLENPDLHFPIFSPLHRHYIAKHLLEISYDENTFEEKLSAYFNDFQIQFHHPDNKTYWLTAFLYLPEIEQLWQFDEKESHLQPEMEYMLVAEPEMPYARVFSDFPLNQIFYGVPGTGKTHHSRLEALAIAEQQPIEWIHLQTPEWILERWQYHNQPQGQIAMLTFHQAMAYEDFIEGIKPKTQKGNISYELEDGLLKNIAIRAAQNPRDNYVLVLDEINRGNVAAIFGELITLLDADKRQGGPNALSVLLPYSKQPFSLPANLHFIGTMNSTDRSVAPLDAALRRRFRFRAFEPRPDLLPSDVEGIDLQQLLMNMNQRLQALLGQAYSIGHAYLMDVKSLTQLEQVFQYQLLPLLLDYFYGDLAKIGCVLGEGFVETLPAGRLSWARFDYEGRLDEGKSQYRLRDFPLGAKAYLMISD